MELSAQYKIYRDEKMHKYLLQNSEWFKYLNRDEKNYAIFEKAMREKYRLNITNKISDTIDNIDLISSLLKTLK